MRYVYILIVLIIAGCFNLDYYSKAEIIYKVKDIKTDIKLNENQIEVNGYFENIGEGKNVGIQKVSMEIFYSYFGDYYSERKISVQSNSSTNKILNNISLDINENKSQKLIFDINNSDRNTIKDLIPSRIVVDIFYY